MIPDPLAAINRRLASTLGGPVARRASPSYQLTPEEENSLIGRVGGSALSGISAVGNVLDLPGSMVRDLLGGQNPLDQLLSPLSSENRLTGRDLLRRGGLIGSQDTTGNWWGGLGAEIALDPLTYLSLGGSALTKAGQVAKKAGALAKVGKAAKVGGTRLGRMTSTLDDLVRVGGKETARPLKEYAKGQGKTLRGLLAEHGGEKLGGLVGIGLPFSEPMAVLGRGAAAQKVAGVLDKGSRALRYNRVTRPLAAIFDHSNQGALTEAGQKIGRESTQNLERAAAAARQRVVPIARAFEELDTKTGLFDPQRVGQDVAIENAQSVRRYLEESAGKPGVRVTGIDFEPWQITREEFLSGRPSEPLGYIDEVSQSLASKAGKPGLTTESINGGRAIVYRGTNGLPLAVANIATDGSDRVVSGFARDFTKGVASQRAALEVAGELLKRGVSQPADSMSADAASLIHRLSVEKAIAQGKDVPTDVLAEYPKRSPAIRRAIEQSGTLSPTEAWKALPAELEPLRGQLDTMKSSVKEIRSKELAAGLPSPALDDIVEYFPRTKKFFDVPGKTGRAQTKVLDTATPFQIGRQSPLKAHVGGTEVLNRMSLDKAISGIAHTFADGKMPPEALAGVRKHILDNYLGGGISPGDDVDWDGLARWVANLDPRHAAEKVPAFELNPVASLTSRLEHGQRAIGAADAVVDLLAKEAKLPHQLLGRGASLDDMITKAGLTDVARDRLLEKVTGAIDGLPSNPTRDALKSLYVPEEIAADAQRFLRSFTTPDEVGPLLAAIDGFTSLFKTSVTALFPSFHARNFISGQFQNFIGGAADPKAIGPMRYLQPILDAHGLLTGKPIAGMTAEQSKHVADLAYVHGILGPKSGATGEAMGRVVDAGSEIPGIRPLRTPAPAGTTRLQRANPLNVAGVMAKSDVFAPARIGRDVGHYVEGLNRLAPFVAYLKQGLPPAEAARRVKMLQLDYSALSKVERSVMKRVMPFYSFTRRQLPFFLEELTQRPGGKLGQTIRTMNRARDPNQMTPDYVAETASIPLGQLADGSSRYLTGFGLMHEDPLSFLGGGFRGAGLEALSRTNPLIKGPLEMATGQSFFQRGPLGGRPIDDLDPTIGRIMSNVTGQEKPVTFPGSQAVESIAGNSPISRLLTTARQVSDPRKRSSVGAASGLAANLLTGARVSDISPGAQEAILRERLQQVMGTELGGRVFSRAYIPKDVREAMPPDERKEAERVMALMNLLAKRAKERKAKK